MSTLTGLISTTGGKESEVGTMEWADLAEWYDEKQGDEGDFWHRTLLDPALFGLIGEVGGMRILDVPCGNGHNTRRLARLGGDVVGVDLSAPLIGRNRRREEHDPLGITYHAADAAQMGMLADDSFDLVVSQMGLMDLPDASGALGEMGRVLRPGGRLVALFSHPCFDIPGASAWVEETMYPPSTVWRKVRRYAEPFAGQAYWRVHGRLTSTPSYHRPLSWYVRALRSAGLVLTALEEPGPSKEFLAGEPAFGAFMTEVPIHVLIEARKIDL